MNRHINDSPALNYEACYQYLDEVVFRLNEASARPLIGLEAEMFPYFSSSALHQQIEAVPLGSSNGLAPALEDIANNLPHWQCVYADEASPRRGGLQSISIDHLDFVTFEPGGQVEISTRPFEKLSLAVNHLNELRKLMRSSLGERGISLLSAGLHPWLTTEQIGLQMAKPRYKSMDEFFSKKGPFGRVMMRQTATVQVNLDYGSSEHVLAQRYLASNLLAPIATAIFANSAFSEGVPNGSRSFRAKAWHNLDHSRTGFPDLKLIAAKLDKASCVRGYMDRFCNLEVAFGPAGEQCPDGFTFSDWLEKGLGSDSMRPTIDSLKTNLSLYFPEVRARGFFELRSVDMQSSCWLSVPASFYVSLLYDHKSLSKVLELLEPYLPRLQELWLSSSRGLECPTIAYLAKTVMNIAWDGFLNLKESQLTEGSERIQNTFRTFIQHFTERGRTPADDCLDVFMKSHEKKLLPMHFLNLEESWHRLLH